MFTKLTTATLMTSLFLVACEVPPVETSEMVEIPPTEAMPTERAPDETPPTDPQPVQENAVQIDGLDLRGTYAMDGVACDFLAGTMTIAETSIRLTETVCKIVQAREVNASKMEYALSDCQSEGVAEPDRTITVAQDEFGNLNVTKWNDQTFVYNMCPS